MDCMSCHRSTPYEFHIRLPLHMGIGLGFVRNTSWLSRLISLSGWSVHYGRQGNCPCQNRPIGCDGEYSSWTRLRGAHRQVSYHTRKCDACSFPLDWGNWWIVHQWLHPRVLQTCKWKSCHILLRDLGYCSSGIDYERGKQCQPWFKIKNQIFKFKKLTLSIGWPLPAFSKSLNGPLAKQ